MRLGDFGENTPKGLIKLPNGETLLGKLIADLEKTTGDKLMGDPPASALSASDWRAGRICIVTNARFDGVYRKWLAGEEFSDKVEVYSNGVEIPEKKNGAIRDLYLAIKHFRLENDSLLVCPSDTYYDFSFSDFLDFIYKNNDEIVTIVRKMESRSEIKERLGCATLNGDIITSFVEKPVNPPSQFAAIPFYFYPAQKLNLINKYLENGGNPDAPGNIISWLLKEGIKIKAYVVKGKTLDVGTKMDVEKLKGM